MEDAPSIRLIEPYQDAREAVKAMAEEGLMEDPFYILDQGEVVRKFEQWTEAMPRVRPFYAVKCNPDPTLLGTLADLGAGFDCASIGDIKAVTDQGIGTEHIIFANPAKMASHIRYAKSVGVNMSTFDCEDELMKMKKLHPENNLVIRIRCDATDLTCPFGLKFGCDPLTEAPKLLEFAAKEGLNVIGVAFHVGSNTRQVDVYARALSLSRGVWDAAARAGHRMRLLDIGGGFPGSRASIDAAAAVINKGLAEHFPEPAVQVIAEPGRYFAETAFSLACQIYSKKDASYAEDTGSHTMYFINDGIYGSFKGTGYDKREFIPEPVQVVTAGETALGDCSLWGPTCDSSDRVVSACRLPPLAAGDWLVFRNMGDYTLSVASTFNGFPVPRVRAVLPAASAARTRSTPKNLKKLGPAKEDTTVERKFNAATDRINMEFLSDGCKGNELWNRVTREKIFNKLWLHCF